ncbi:hypothetical protein ACFCV8_07625 [Streptomyces sp. NPDC056347]|uniref:hypothetical protein n=1 Tax=unclassified Streptomyces TaxID=2593676 RepID=UPI0035E05162
MSIDVRPWEYATFAPAGHICPACLEPVRPFDRCLRGGLPRQDGGPVTLYRHIDCGNPESPPVRRSS